MGEQRYDRPPSVASDLEALDSKFNTRELFITGKLLFLAATCLFNYPAIMKRASTAAALTHHWVHKCLKKEKCWRWAHSWVQFFWSQVPRVRNLFQLHENVQFREKVSSAPQQCLPVEGKFQIVVSNLWILAQTRYCKCRTDSLFYGRSWWWSSYILQKIRASQCATQWGIGACHCGIWWGRRRFSAFLVAKVWNSWSLVCM